MKIRIDEIVRKDYTSQSGKPYSKVWIKSNGTYYNAFAGKWNEFWKAGDTVQVWDIDKQEGQDGRVYNNIQAPSVSACMERIDKLERRLESLINSGIEARQPEPEQPEQVQSESEIPF